MSDPVPFSAMPYVRELLQLAGEQAKAKQRGDTERYEALAHEIELLNRYQESGRMGEWLLRKASR